MDASKNIKHVYPVEQYNLDAPQEIVPFLIEIFQPQSVVDVGCGTGTFLHVFNVNGVNDILGIDGSWVDKSTLFIPEYFFVEKDLEKDFEINKKFDLVLCLEVAEHLAESAADNFIQQLTNLGDVIIFSAAINNQGGQNHINEQPFKYWVKKFAKWGYEFHDIFRIKFWNNPRINWWYRQNMFLVVHHSVDISKFNIVARKQEPILEYVHPDLLAMQVNDLRKFKAKIEWIKEGRAPVYFYFQLLKNKVFSKFLKRSSL